MMLYQNDKATFSVTKNYASVDLPRVLKETGMHEIDRPATADTIVDLLTEAKDFLTLDQWLAIHTRLALASYQAKTDYDNLLDSVLQYLSATMPDFYHISSDDNCCVLWTFNKPKITALGNDTSTMGISDYLNCLLNDGYKWVIKSQQKPAEKLVVYENLGYEKILADFADATDFGYHDLHGIDNFMQRKLHAVKQEAIVR